jgi:hypothetical protein
MKVHMGVEVFLHSFLILKLDGVICQLKAQAVLQPVKIIRHALRSGWARVVTFRDALEKRQLLPLPRIELWSLGRLDCIVIFVPTEPFRLQLIIYYCFTLLRNFLSYFYSPFRLLPYCLQFNFFALSFLQCFFPPVTSFLIYLFLFI